MNKQIDHTYPFMKGLSEYLDDSVALLAENMLKDLWEKDHNNYLKLTGLSQKAPDHQTVSQKKKSVPEPFESECRYFSNLIDDCFANHSLTLVGLYLCLNFEALVIKKVDAALNPPVNQTLSPFVYVMQ